MSATYSPSLDRPIPHAHAGGEHCPWCDQPIPREKFEEISDRIARRERQQQAEALSRYKEQAARETAEAVALAKEEARRAAETAMQAKLAEAEQVKAELAVLKTSHDTVVAQRLAEQREALEKAKIAAVQAAELKAFEDKQKFEAKVQDLQRQIQNKTAEELGDTAEIDLFETLKAAFVEDRIARVEKGAAGPDIIHDIVHGGKVCGRIVYDAKNRGSWRNDYVTKLRQDQMTAKAEHAVLASRNFPAGARQLHLADGVIIVEPQRVTVLAELLRRHIVQTHTLRVSGEARAQKTDDLYAFITSENCAVLLASMMAHTRDMADLDDKERRAHDLTWKTRDKLIRSVQRAHGDLTGEVDRIIGVAPGT